MASVFLDRRDKHLKKSEAFLHAAKLRLGDNLPYRAALSDAVEAIRHSLQAYLWMRVSAAGAGSQSVEWQEIAVKASMPELVAAASDAGLSLNKAERETVMELARVRNHFTHDSPQSGRLITSEVAERAVAIANGVDQRVQRALGTQQPAAAAATRAESAPSAGGAVHAGPKPPARPAGAASGGPASGAATPAPAVPTTPAVAGGATSAAGASGQAEPTAGDEDLDEPDAPDDTTTMPALTRRRGGRLPRLLSAAAMLVLGVAAGSAVTYPVATGRVPAWVPYASHLAAPTATAVVTVTSVPRGPFVAGNLLITPSACTTIPATLTLRNTGAGPIAWAVGSPDALSAAFADGESATAHPTLTGQLAADASVTLTVAGLPAGGAHVVVIADGGTVAFPLGVC